MYIKGGNNNTMYFYRQLDIDQEILDSLEREYFDPNRNLFGYIDHEDAFYIKTDKDRLTKKHGGSYFYEDKIIFTIS